MLELRHLRYFEAVGTALSFSRAAEKLHIAQPPLSRQIQQLEEELGATLINRQVRPLALTPAGKFFLEQSVQLLARLTETREATRRIAQGQRTSFGIGFVPSALYGVLPELIRQFRANHADVEVHLCELTSIQQVDALKAGRIDVGFGRLVLDDPDIQCERILEEPMAVALPAGHALLTQDTLGLDQVVGEPLVLYPARPRPSYADEVLKLYRTHGLQPKVAMEANELQTAIGLVAAGVGIALVPDSVRRLHRDDVAYRLLTNQDALSPVIMNARAGDQSTLLARWRLLASDFLRRRQAEA